MRRKKLLLFVISGLFSLIFSTGCIQEALVIPVATVTGKVIVPAAKVALGVHITVAGDTNKSCYVNEYGDYKLEFNKTGRYLLIARGRDFDVDYVWVDAVLEETVTATDFVLPEKIVGEGKWLATIVDFPSATGFVVKSLDPKWATETYRLYDDGTHDDKYAGDGIYALRLANLPTGSQLYSIVWNGPEGDKEEKDPHAENTRNDKSELIIREPDMKVARGKVTSTLTGVNYSEVVLGTKGGARKIFLNSDGTYSLPMEGNGREYLVFRSSNFNIRAIPVNLSTMPIYDVPDVALAPKAPGEAKFVLVKSDFQDVGNPSVVADFTSWQPQALYDDATHGDEVAGDGVYTLVIANVSPGYHKYAFNLTTTSQVRDPYQESGDSQYSILLVK
ncbi:MAG: hypothetical protein HQM10_19435 [Candidatus Riflebacteria bacterium]|nr:hypothetical protein [Candidatus Riflebacteria bacterium]